jgi:PAS domain S-box-containing protein
VVFAVVIASCVDVLVMFLVPLTPWRISGALWAAAHIAMHLPTLLLLRATRSVAIASNYFIAVVFLQSALQLEASAGLSGFGFIAVPVAATHLGDLRSGIVWTVIAAASAIALPELMGLDPAARGTALAIATVTLAIGAASAIVEDSRARAFSRQEAAEESVQLQRERLRAFVEAAFPCIAEVNEGRLVFASDSVVELIGYTPREAVEMGAAIVHPDDVALLGKRVCAATPERSRAEIRVIHRDGQTRWLEVHAIPIGVTPRDARWLFAARNIDDEVRHRERIEQVQRLEGIGTLAAGIAHDFNNLLTVISGFGERLPPSSARDQVLGAAASAAELTSQLLAFGRSGPRVDALIDPELELRSLEPMIRSLLGEAARLTLSGSAEGATARIEAGRLKQILLNLVTNAKEAMPSGGRVDIKLARVVLAGEQAEELGVSPGPFVRIALSDDGAGMTDEVRRRAFDPFFSTKGPERGSGLGLASAYGIARRCQGTIELESAPGHGTTARVYLPDAEEGLESPRERSPGASVGGRKPPVWLVEDDARILELMRGALDAAGYETRAASSAEQALSWLEHEAPPLVLVSDVVMPGMRGPDLASLLRAKQPSLRVLFISGYSEGELGDWRSGEKHVHFLPKPFRPSLLVSAVEALAAD